MKRRFGVYWELSAFYSRVRFNIKGNARLAEGHERFVFVVVSVAVV